jgi:hypothetical protein
MPLPKRGARTAADGLYWDYRQRGTCPVSSVTGDRQLLDYSCCVTRLGPARPDRAQ